MSYQKQAFMAYMHDEKGNGNPGAYCNGLDNIEKLLSVDIDAEFSNPTHIVLPKAKIIRTLLLLR